MLLSDLDSVEKLFKMSVECAEKTKFTHNKALSQTQSVFMWQNNLLKFYMEHDIGKAIDYSKELIDELGNILPKNDLSDLRFSLATSYALQGDTDMLDSAQDLFKASLADALPAHRGFIHNNLGMTHFYKFVALSSTITDP